ncbi:MAG: hypothetical protein JWN27_2952 [Candidatus Eremiobacteraeota bacterium]|nr:hypothetical protein [Candidatus Eremiobacteraeota bacterium]
MPAEIVQLHPVANPLAFVRVAGTGTSLVHYASTYHYGVHLTEARTFRSPSPLITLCTVRLSAPALAEKAVTCTSCAPSTLAASMDVTDEMIAGCIA